MALSTNIQNNLVNKILVIKLNYIDSDTLTVKTKFYSNDFCKIYDNIISGNLLTPEIILEKIPSFIKEIDFIENQTIIKSDYNIVLNNLNEELHSFFLNNIFTNQKVEFYITTELDYAEVNSTYGEFKLLAVANINEIQIEDNIQIKLKELNLFEQKLITNFKNYDYNNKDSSLDSEFMPINVGSHTNLKVENIRKCSIDLEDKYLVGTTTAFKYDISSGYTKLTVSTTLAETLRRNLKPGDKIFVQDNTCGEDGSSIAISYVQQGFMTSTSTDYIFYFEKSNQLNELGSGKNIYILVDDAYNVNNNLLVTQSVVLNSTYFTNKDNFFMKTKIAEFSNDWTSTGKWIKVTDSMPFLRNGDIVKLYCKRSINANSWNYEQLIVDYFDSTNNKIYLLNDWVSESVIPGSGTINSTLNRDNYELHYEAVQKINIENTDFINRFKSFEIGIGDVSDLMDQVNSPAELVVNTTDLYSMLFTSTKIAYLGNQDRIKFINSTLTAPYTPTISYTSNAFGGNDITVTYYDGNTTHSQILALTFPNMTQSSTGTGVFLLDISKQNVWMQLSGGKYSSSFFTFHTSDSSSSLQEPLPFVYYFRNISNPLSAYSTDLSYFVMNLPANQVRELTFATGWTQDQLGQYISDQINGDQRGTGSYKRYFVSYYNSTTKRVVVKMTYQFNFDITGSFFANYTGSSFGIYNINNAPKCWTQNYRLNADSVFEDKTDMTINRRFEILLDKTGLSIAKNLNQSQATFGAGIKIEGLAGTYPFNRRTITLDASAKDYFKSNEKAVVVNKHNYITVVDSSMRTVYKNANNLRYFHYRDNRDGYDDRVYVNKEFTYDVNNTSDNSSYVNFKFYELINTTGDIFVTIHSPLEHFSDMLIQAHLIYDQNISDIDLTKLNTLKTNHPKLVGNFDITKNDTMLYKAIQPILQSFNLNSYINNNGILTYEFLNVFDSSTYVTINNYDIKDFKVYANQYENIKVIYNILKNKKDDTFTIKTFSSTFLNSINSLLKLTNNKEIDTVIEKDFFADTYVTKTYEELFTKKYFSQFKYVEIFLPIDFVNDLDIYTNINLINNPYFDSSKKFKIYKIENDFETLKVTAMLLP